MRDSAGSVMLLMARENVPMDHSEGTVPGHLWRPSGEYTRTAFRPRYSGGPEIGGKSEPLTRQPVTLPGRGQRGGTIAARLGVLATWTA